MLILHEIRLDIAFQIFTAIIDYGKVKTNCFAFNTPPTRRAFLYPPIINLYIYSFLWENHLLMD